MNNPFESLDRRLGNIEQLLLDIKHQPVKPTNIYRSDEQYTRKQTSNKLKISLPTLDDYTRRGIIRGCRVGRRVLYRAEDVEAALKEINTVKYQRS